MTCRNDIASTLMTMVTDESGGVNETSMTHTFTETDGVEAAMEYRCDVTLSVNNLNMTSGSSPPAFVTTLTLNGRSVYRTIMVGLMVRALDCRSRGRWFDSTYRHFKAWAISFIPNCLCLSEEMLTHFGPFYLCLCMGK